MLSIFTPHRRSAGYVAWLLPLAVALFGPADACRGAEANGRSRPEPQSDPQAASAKPAPTNPVVQLIRDPAVQEELKLAAGQVAQIDAGYAKIERALWSLRDASSGPLAEKRAKLVDAFEAELAGLLQPAQLARLRQLLVQSQGWQSLTGPRMVAELKLSDGQQRQIDQTTTSTAAKIQALSAAPQPAGGRHEALLKLRRQEGATIQQSLTAKQRRRLAELVGAKYDVSNVRTLTFSAPPLGQVDRWINTQPLTPAGTRGKVVAFHFWAFGCINCIHNLPHYNAWHEQMGQRGLLVWGMHTPETAAEHDLSALEKKVRQYQIAYPVSADHENQNWNAWANYLWPSVYLVDKRGNVRYWWYGELNWQGAEGEKIMRERIEQLLSESE
jgi:hypothetical protein